MRLKQKYIFNFIFMALAVQYVILCFVIFFMGHHKNVEKIHNKIIEDFSDENENFYMTHFYFVVAVVVTTYNTHNTYPYQRNHLQELRDQSVLRENDLILNEQFVTELSMLRYGSI